MELKSQQPAMTIAQQIENLKALGLIIEDIEHAESFLNDVSYFRLIKAYSLGYKPKNGRYNDGTTFDMLEQLYLFNANLRQLIFTQIERVEVNLRCRIANYYSSKYGVLGYKEAGNFKSSEHHKHFLRDIEAEVERNRRSPFVKNFKENYEEGQLPLYALVELFSFGLLSKFYKNMNNSDKKSIASTYGVGYTYLESWFEHLAFIRNVCAHYGRLYNCAFPKTPRLYNDYTDQGIGNNRIFASLICLKHLIPSDRHWNEFVEKIYDLLEKYPAVEPERMGFPENWKEYLVTNSREEIVLA